MILQRIKVNCLEIDDATVNGVDGIENKGELLRDDIQSMELMIQRIKVNCWEMMLQLLEMIIQVNCGQMTLQLM